MAFETAADAAAESLKAGMYEENAVEVSKKVFEYTFSAVLDTYGEGTVEIGLSINGAALNDPKELKKVKQGDRIDVSFSYGPFTVNVPGRRMTYEKTTVRTVTLD